MTNVASVIVFGASGNVGHYVVPALLEAGVKVTVATRADSTASFPPGAQVATADYKSLASLTSIIRGHESVISLVGPAALTDQKHLIDAAIAAGATYFIPSEFGHDVTDERVVPLLPVANAKRAVTAYLCEKEKEGLSWTSIVTALFFDWGLPLGFFDIDLKGARATIWDGGNTPFSASTMDDITSSIVRLVTELPFREQFKNQHVYVSSVQTTQNEILAAVEAVVGKKFEVTHHDGEESLKGAGGPLVGGYTPGVLQLIKGVQLSGRRLCDFESRVAEGNNKFIVNSKKSVEGVVRKVVAR